MRAAFSFASPSTVLRRLSRTFSLSEAVDSSFEHLTFSCWFSSLRARTSGSAHRSLSARPNRSAAPSTRRSASALAFCINIRLAWASFLLNSATIKAASEVDVSATAALNSETKTKSPSGKTKNEGRLNVIRRHPTPIRRKNPSHPRPMHQS